MARCYVKGEIVFQRGDKAAGIVAVVSGQVKEACQSIDGDEKIIEVFGANQSFGAASLFLGRSYPFSVTAIANTQLLHVDGQTVLGVVDRHPAFCRRLLEELSARICALFSDVEAYTVKTSLQRVVDYLIGCCAADAPVIHLPATKLVIASRLGISAEGLSRVFRELTAAGVIEMHGNRVTVLSMSSLVSFAHAAGGVAYRNGQ